MIMDYFFFNFRMRKIVNGYASDTNTSFNDSKKSTSGLSFQSKHSFSIEKTSMVTKIVFNVFFSCSNSSVIRPAIII